MKPLSERTWAPLSPSVAVAPLDPRVRLELATHVRLIHEDGAVRKIELGGRIASLDAEDGQRVAALLGRLDGARTLDEVSRDLGWALDDTIEAAQDLYHLAVLENAGDSPIQALSFFQHVSALGRGVQARIGEDTYHTGQFLADLMGGRLHRRLVLGYFVELFHVVIRAALHISPTINLAPNQRLRMMLSEYLGDEYWHGLWLRQGLRAAGLTDAQLDGSDPLPGTLAAVDRLVFTAHTDILAYSACISTGEAAGEAEMERARRKYETLVRSGLLPEEAIAPFRDHELADCSAGHFSYCAEFYAEAAPITRPHQDSIRRAMLAYLRCLEEQHREIERFYGENEDGPPVYTAGWTPPRHSAPSNLSPDAVAERLGDASFRVYDCNTLDTYRAGHLPGAIWVDPAGLTARALPKDPRAAVVFYCSGERCTACLVGAERAAQLGFKNVYVMRAGIEGWQRTGRPLERSGTASP
ncbi:MAG TPA: rhodanese-like domain-containing protein [Kofleriaceae bacterium]|nr:rhodanese-like domain-containing protein [Kofleriaceae bacterium]